MPEMNVVFIKAFSLDDAWFQCIKSTVEKGFEYVVTRGSYEGQKRKELDFIVVQITNPGTRPLAPMVPEGMAAPTDNASIEKYFLEYVATDQKKPKEDYTYGQRLDKPGASLIDECAPAFKMKDISQIEEIIRMYKECGHGTNQATMEIAMPFDIQLKDPPCMRMIDTRIRYGKLHFMPYFRSWDLIGGFPANLGALQLLKEHIAKKIGVEDGEIIALSKGLHIYEHYWNYAKIRTYKK